MNTGFHSFLRFGAAPLAIAFACQPALAADAPQAAPGAIADEPIVVTGTRIRLPNLDSKEPMVSIGRDQIAARGLTNVADVLNESPGVRGSTTAAGAQTPFGQAMNFVNLYGLGTNRTLVLVNGKRQVSSQVPAINGTPGNPVDLNTIPTILVDRIDRIGVGGAPVYGTDAIAGTINVILKRRMKGLELDASSGFTSEGDNLRLNFAAAGGKDFAGGRGNITAAVSWDKMDGVLWNDRWFYRNGVIPATNPCSTFGAGQVCTTSASASYLNSLGTPGRAAATDGRVNPNIGFNNTTTDGVPGSILVANLSRPALSPNGVIASGAGAYNWQFSPSGNLVAFNRGTPFGALVTSNPVNARASGGDGFRANDYNQVISALTRLNTALFLTYDLTDNVRLTFDGTWSHSRGDQLTTQPSFNATILSGRSAALTFRVDNPFLSTQARQQLLALKYPANGTFTLSRSNDDLSDQSGYTDSDVYRGVLGLDGKFDLAGRNYNFEVYADYGRSDIADHFQDIDQQKFINAINVASVGGQIVCTTAATVTGTTPIADPNCKPLNLFGYGVASPEALAYIRRDTVSRSQLEQVVVNANVGGSPFDLNSNPVSFNLGFEHHMEKARFSPDPFVQSGSGRLTAVSPVSGEYHLNELFGELLVPVIAPGNQAAVDKLELFARARVVGSSLANGGFTAWAVGGAFAPVRDIELRGNFTRSFRAPSIFELYLPQTSGAVAVAEPCADANILAGPAPAVRAANCAAYIAKYGKPTSPAAGFATLSGNPGLHNEQADSFTYGAILRPRFVPGLSLAVDYINIKLRDPIALLQAASNNTSTDILSACFDNTDFNAADPAHGNAYCSMIRRNSNGSLAGDLSSPGITQRYINGKRMRFDGVQATLDWRGSLGPIGLPGNLALGADAFFVRNRLVDLTGVAPTQSEGLFGDPKFQGQARLAWAGKVVGFSSQVNVTGAQAVAYTQRGDAPNDVREIDHYDPYATVDGAVWVQAPQDIRVTFSVTNLFNRVGQTYYGQIIRDSVNDALGRRFVLGARKKF